MRVLCYCIVLLTDLCPGQPSQKEQSKLLLIDPSTFLKIALVFYFVFLKETFLFLSLITCLVCGCVHASAVPMEAGRLPGAGATGGGCCCLMWVLSLLPWPPVLTIFTLSQLGPDVGLLCTLRNMSLLLCATNHTTYKCRYYPAMTSGSATVHIPVSLTVDTLSL